VILERVAQQAGASWNVSYVIEAADAPEPSPIVVPRIVTPEPARAVLPTAPSAAPELTVAPPSGPVLRANLMDGINHVVRAEPSRRRDAVQDFLAYGELLFRAMEPLPLEDRRQRIRVAWTVLTPWRRLYRGLAPDVQRELKPISLFLEDRLRFH
jgi:hypothetical protein